jgi:hypothetical protein
MRCCLHPSGMGVMERAKVRELRVAWYPRGSEPSGAEEDSLHTLKEDEWKRNFRGPKGLPCGRLEGLMHW